ncbi:FMN-binding negative transcriptional regulator [Jannaschia sp. Os4]|uniref:FMN-binding negative transcriptional regulator n=1 Tax=Jannaschia sp. Os4 TaxID=2807617 RepID=UPI0019399DD6|nr:FMN-binding negative transcriptional regulator [Jannaschia sp. Os4]MBM2575452.1 FMN-binding negative transcriptional regulator [Jannaschia sp. Os4]
MHPNPAFRAETRDRALALVRDRGFGTLAVNAEGGPLLSHVPLLLAEDGASADLHLVRSNPIARLGETAAVVAVMGPDAYISPDWYEVPDQVPTWNYAAVHLRGTLRPLPEDAMHDMLDRQSAAYEVRLLPKRPWTTAKMDPDVLARMMRQILPFRLEVDAVDATFKTSQNKPETARLKAAYGVETGPIGHETMAMAKLMRDG